MADSIRSKVLNEIFLAPSALLPIVAGASSLLLAWGMGSVQWAAAGMVGVLGGIGWMATRAIFGIEKITERVVLEERENARRREEALLEELMLQLRSDTDPRNDEYLATLRDLKREFDEAVEKPGIQVRSLRVAEQVRQLFEAAIMQLRRTHELWLSARRLTREHSQQILRQREELLQEVGKTVHHFRSAIQQFGVLTQSDPKFDLSQLRDELDASIRVAMRTEERMREIENQPNYDKFLKE